MNRAIEDRLVAALEARAELVTTDDLGPVEVPDRPRRPPRTAVLLLVAAASAAVIATPFVVGDRGGVSPEPGPAGSPSTGVTESDEPTPTASTTPSEAPTEQRDAIVTGRQRADLDGDGAPDQVRVLFYGPSAEDPAEGAVEVSLANGATGVAALPFGYPPDLLPAFDINGDGREQLLMRHSEGGDLARLLVYTWHEGGLVRAQGPRDAPLALELDGQGKAADHYTDEGRLFSWLRLDPVDPAGGPWFEVEQWSWAVEGDRLVATPAGKGCIDATQQDPPGPC